MKYDDASWHSEGDFPKGLPPEAGAIHIGMFLAWAIERDLAAPSLRESAPEAFDAVRRRDLTGAQFLLLHCDGKLLDEDLSEEGAAFARTYYEQKYLSDYCRVLKPYLDADTGANFQKVEPLLDERLQAWRRVRVAPIEPTTDVRARGLLELCGGIAGAGVMGFVAYRRTLSGHLIGPDEAILLALPGALGLAGLLEAATGIPVLELSGRWDSLQGWQRGVMGTALAVAALFVAVVGMVIWLR